MTQDEALAILRTGASVFLTGEPGSGKTHTVNRYVEYLRKCRIEPAITASTGIAATHIQGMTVHSWSGIGIREGLTAEDLDQIAENRWAAERITRARALIIDELSMLSARTLSMVDAVCRRVRRSPGPFGGLQVVLVGDFFQLPPVVQKRRETLRLLPDEEEDGVGAFAYQSRAWSALDPVVCYLTEQHRQEDADFLRILSAIRGNACSPEDRARIRSRIGAAGDAADKAPRIFPYNADVDRINAKELARLPGESRAFRMAAQGAVPLVKMLKDGCLSPEELTLKTDARVMFTRNNPAEGFVNGTLGTVVEFAKDSGYPVVRTYDGRSITAEPVEWTVDDGGRRVAKITQIPLRLAWAITVHKSQGLSLDAAVMDLSGAFEYGQGYVALSRVRTLSGLHVLGVNDRAFQVHPEVLAKDREFRAASAHAHQAFAAMGREELEGLEAHFISTAGGKAPATRGKHATRPREGDENRRMAKPEPRGKDGAGGKTYSVEEIRATHRNAYAPWTEGDDVRLEQEARAGGSVEGLARRFGRNAGAIRARLRKLGLR